MRDPRRGAKILLKKHLQNNNPIYKKCLGEEILNVFKLDLQYMENEEKYTVETLNQLIKHLNNIFLKLNDNIDT